MAALYNHSKVIKLLIDSGADAHMRDLFGRNAYMHASTNGYTEIATMIENADLYKLRN
jgi:ankyrin repeat protein